jgi:hypothetical protein
MNNIKHAAALVALTAAATFAHATPSAAGVFSANETIVDNGNSTYTYNYTLTNLSSSPAAWWFIVETQSNDAYGPTAFNGGVNWSAYVASNFYTSVAGWSNTVYTYTSGDDWPSSVPDGVQLGQTLGTLSYTSSLYDPEQKVFLVDVEGYWNNPEFSYQGLTNTAAVPEADTLALMLAGLGLVGLVARRRRAN